MIHIYEERAAERFEPLYDKDLSLANIFDTKEKWLRLCGQQINRKNISSETVKE